jgi:hypothetical protein
MLSEAAEVGERCENGDARSMVIAEWALCSRKREPPGSGVNGTPAVQGLTRLLRDGECCYDVIQE